MADNRCKIIQKIVEKNSYNNINEPMYIHNIINKFNNYNKLIFINILIIMFIFNLSLISANFVCGEVKDSIDNRSSSWYFVNIFYSDKPENINKCEVSPAGNKFCCDAEEIPRNFWKIGLDISAEIYDNVSGYLAGPVKLKSSGEGYDIFPEMRLEKGIKLNSIIKRLIYSKNNKLNLDLSFKEPYNNAEITINNNNWSCDNCSGFNQTVDVNFGMNNISITTKHNDRKLHENIVFGLINDFNFNRDFSCNGCNKDKIKQNKEINVVLSINLSDEITNMQLKEYVPKTWEILDLGGGELKEYSESHNIIVWNVSGKSIIKSYKIKSPKINILPSSFIFISELEDIGLSNQSVYVKNLIPFFYKEYKLIYRKIRKTIYSRISPDRALVFKLKNNGINQIALFPKKQLENVEFSLENNYSNDELNNVMYSYLINTNIKKSDIDNIIVEFYVNKSLLKENNYYNVSMYVFKDNSWEENEIELLGEDENNYYYKASFSYADKFAIVGEKRETGILGFLLGR